MLPFEPSIYQFKIVLMGSKPSIWRRFLVPADIKLGKLHLVIQVVMGWQNAHLHEFKVGKISFGEPAPEYEGRMLDQKNVSLRGIAQEEKTKLRYIYDFGDGWQHELTLEKILVPKPGERYPICLDGARSCPPEDCGGIGGYARLLEALENPKTQEQRDLVAWAGEFDPDAFDLDAVNARLKRIR